MPKRILLDESVPAGIARILTSHEVKTAPEMGWAGIANGRLLDLAEQDGFDIMVTSDTNIRFQNRLAGRRIALVVATTNHWDTIRMNPADLVAACDSAAHGEYLVVRFPKPPRRRRPPPSLDPD
jgi:hypothetical protein